MDQDDNVLMQRRPLASVHGGLWEFPGGKVEAGESPEAAAIREIAEELHVAIEPDALVPVSFASGSTASPLAGGPAKARALVILLYACRAWTGTPRASDGAKLGWYPQDQVPDLAMPPLDYPLAHALKRGLHDNMSPDAI